MSDFLTIKDVCALLHVSRHAVMNYYKTLGLPAYRVGKQVLFIREELMEWVRARKIPPTRSARRDAGKKILDLHTSRRQNGDRNKPNTAPSKGGARV